MINRQKPFLNHQCFALLWIRSELRKLPHFVWDELLNCVTHSKQLQGFISQASQHKHPRRAMLILLGPHCFCMSQSQSHRPSCLFWGEWWEQHRGPPVKVTFAATSSQSRELQNKAKGRTPVITPMHICQSGFNMFKNEERCLYAQGKKILPQAQ